MLLADDIRSEKSLPFALDVSRNRPSSGSSDKMDKTQFESLDQMADATASAFSQAAASNAFQLFKDDLFKLILQSLTRFYFEFRLKIEGVKITPFDRAHLAVKRSLDCIRTKKKD
jgi:hypothetical protein